MAVVKERSQLILVLNMVFAVQASIWCINVSPIWSSPRQLTATNSTGQSASTKRTTSSNVFLRTAKLPLNMLNCLKNKGCIHISYHILGFVQQKNIKLTMEQPYMLLILCYQYHACWCPGDFRSQDISRHGMDQIRWNIPSLTSEALTIVMRSHHKFRHF